MPEPVRSSIKNYFSITKREWNGMVVLVILIAVALAMPYLYAWLHKDSTIDLKQYNQVLAKLNRFKPYDAAEDTEPSDAKTKSEITSRFNPNHLPTATWAALGLNEQQIAVIQHYESNGGKFYYKQDLKKIYSISTADYKRLEPYLSLPDSGTAYHQKPLVMVELNTADSAKLIQVRGIGPAFAMRILHYRVRAGGFYDKAQLKDVFGIDDAKYNEIKGEFSVDKRRLHYIRINEVEFDSLKNNPYLNFKQVNAIIQYRKQHGNYESLSEMKNVAILNDQILRKIAPYLIFK